MKYIEEHKSAVIVTVIIVILSILIGLVIKTMFMVNKDKLGNRLKDAPVIEEQMINTTKQQISENKFVVSVEYNISAVTMKYFIDVKPDTKIEEAKKLSEIVLKNLNDKVKNFYDIEIYLTQKEGKDVNYPAIGYHSKSAEEVTWVINKGEVNEK